MGDWEWEILECSHIFAPLTNCWSCQSDHEIFHFTHIYHFGQLRRSGNKDDKDILKMTWAVETKRVGAGRKQNYTPTQNWKVKWEWPKEQEWHALDLPLFQFPQGLPESYQLEWESLTFEIYPLPIQFSSFRFLVIPFNSLKNTPHWHNIKILWNSKILKA